MERRAVEIVIDLDDIVLHNDASLADEITRNTSRYIQLFSRAIDTIIEDNRNAMASSSSGTGNAIFDPTEAVIDNEDTADVLLAHRMQLLKQNQQQEASLQDPNNLPSEADLRNKLRSMFPPTLFRRYEIRFRPREVSEKNELALRQIKANDLGKLVTVRAIVLRASEVRPILQVAAYTW
jgi:DNA replication licensing factor MCM7